MKYPTYSKESDLEKKTNSNPSLWFFCIFAIIYINHTTIFKFMFDISSLRVAQRVPSSYSPPQESIYILNCHSLNTFCLRTYEAAWLTVLYWHFRYLFWIFKYLVMLRVFPFLTAWFCITRVWLLMNKCIYLAAYL